VRAARIAAGYGATRHGRRGIPDGRHLRDPRLRAEKAVRDRLALSSHEIEDARLSAGPSPSASFDWPTLVANKDKEIRAVEGIYARQRREDGARIAKTRAVLEDAHTLRLTDRREGHREIHPDRDRRRAQPWPRDPRHRARDFLQRGVSSARVCRSAS
jgi:glutathione reductase (NADPH)